MQGSLPNTVAARSTRRVAYQGTAGAFSEEAVYAWRSDAEPYPVRSFAAVIDAVTAGTTNWAVIPIWNSIVGPVPLAQAALEDRSAGVIRVAEVDVPVRQCLMALPGTRLDDVRYVGSHPTALAQCKRVLAEQSLVPCDAYNTAGAARELSMLAKPNAARESAPNAPRDAGDSWYSHLRFDTPARLGVIASENAARHYGLEVLRRDVQDTMNNVTRFVVLRAK